MESLFKHSGPIPGVSLSVALEWDLRICLSIGSRVDAVTARSGGHTLRTTALGRRELNLVRPGFLNLKMPPPGCPIPADGIPGMWKVRNNSSELPPALDTLRHVFGIFPDVCV